MKFIKNSIILITILITACSTQSNGDDDLNTNTTLNTGTTYTLTFESTWSASTHSTNFPSNPHFSGLIGSTHNLSSSLWEEGSTASDGIESMAETGSKSALKDIIKTLIDSNDAQVTIDGGNIGNSPGSVSVTFSISEEFPYVSVVSMLAPSPDWFVGVSGVNLRESGDWVAEKVINLYLYDAGTDSGPDYTSSNNDTNPKENISKLTSTTSGPFNNGLPFVGTFTFTKN